MLVELHKDRKASGFDSLLGPGCPSEPTRLNQSNGTVRASIVLSPRKSTIQKSVVGAQNSYPSVVLVRISVSNPASFRVDCGEEMSIAGWQRCRRGRAESPSQLLEYIRRGLLILPTSTPTSTSLFQLDLARSRSHLSCLFPLQFASLYPDVRLPKFPR